MIKLIHFYIQMFKYVKKTPVSTNRKTKISKFDIIFNKKTKNAFYFCGNLVII